MSTPTEVKKYRFTRSSFKPLVTKPLHFDMIFDIIEDKVTVTLQATYFYTGAEPMTELSLNSKALEIQSVDRAADFTALGPENTPSKDFLSHVTSCNAWTGQEFKVDSDQHLLVVTLAEPVLPQSEFVIKTVSIARPSENILEGLYYDFTPSTECPKTIITQCQQYGFQRIVPCIDTMDAKTYYTTTIIADARYTNMITNGDLAPGYVDLATGLPQYQEHISEDLGTTQLKRHVLKYLNHKVCMAPYLFFLGVGTYITYRQTLEFPDGDTTLLEILTYPGRATPEGSKEAMKSLHDSILWVMVSLGPEAKEHEIERGQIYALLDERESLKAKLGPLIVSSEEKQDKDVTSSLSSEDEVRLELIRQELKTLMAVWTKTGYKYTGAIYREIAMENSYYGGMENVGNTTIVSSCLCPSHTMDDQSYIYMERVKVHEYYHNINGSEVTGATPFEIWLNEAVTVHMERKRYADLFGKEYARLSEVSYMYRPALGPLAQDESPTSLSVEPQGFNQTQELVSVVTYSKAPEFVRMVELILGEDVFHKALDVYHTRHSLGNATTMDWILCMEESSGKALQYLAKCWLQRPGFPKVKYDCTYYPEKQEFHVNMTQSGFDNPESMPEDNREPWDIPVDWSLVKEGQNIDEGLFRLTDESGCLVIENVTDEPDYFSFGRGWSYFGKSECTNMTMAQYQSQAQSDPDAVNRYFAYRKVAEDEKARVITALLAGNRDVVISDEYLELHGKILFDSSLSPSTRAMTLSEPNSTSQENLSHHYIEINEARKALLQGVYSKYAGQILDCYQQVVAKSTPGPHKEQLHDRSLKAHLLNIIILGTSPNPTLSRTTEETRPLVDSLQLAMELLTHSTFMSDRCCGLRHVLECEHAPDRPVLQATIFEEWQQESNMLEKYIATISSLRTSDMIEQVRALMDHECFKLSLSHHSRTTARGLASVRHVTIQTKAGLTLLQDVFLKIGRVNQMSAYPILKCFDELEKFDEAWQREMTSTLESMQAGLDPVEQESLYNQLNIMLKKV